MRSDFRIWLSLRIWIYIRKCRILGYDTESQMGSIDEKTTENLEQVYLQGLDKFTGPLKVKERVFQKFDGLTA